MTLMISSKTRVGVGAGLLALLTFLVSACAQSAGPADAIESYLRALLSGDENKVFATSCPDWEAQAAVDFDAFTGVSGTFDGLECSTSGTGDGGTLVTCRGTLVLNYNGEERERSLEGTTYLARKIDGEWKMCGYR